MSALAPVERTRLAAEEAVIERGLHTFVEVGKALVTIRDQRLYRDGHATFEAYCEQRWGFKDARARQLIAAAETVTNVTGLGAPAPANEGQARALSGLPPEQAADTMRRAHQATDGKPTAEAIRNARPDLETFECEGCHSTFGVDRRNASDVGDLCHECCDTYAETLIDSHGPASAAPRDPIRDAVAEAKARPSSHGSRAVELLEKAHREIKRAGGPGAIVADLEGDPLGQWDNDLAVDTFDRLIPLLTDWQLALRRANLRSVK